MFSVDSPAQPWMQTHAANPVAEHRDGDLFRIYFSTRDEKQRSSIATLDLDITNPNKVLRVSDQPILAPGRIGLFDDSGVSMGWLLRKGEERWLYYLGWNLGVTVPWRNAIGLAISRGEGQAFERISLAPVVDRSGEDPYSVSYPCVWTEGSKHRMLYGSNLKWGAQQTDMEHCLKYAESDDGIHWRRSLHVALGFKDKGEYAMSKPSVLKHAGGYSSWYSYRGDRYRIGYAESTDGMHWIRKDSEVGIDISPSGWDSESIEYPNVFEHRGERYMLYNGNKYGLTGFGLAILES